MDSLRTEEEQVAALKQFWKDYGSAILLGIVLSLGSVYGWKAWKNYRLEQAQASSGLYQELLDLSLSRPGQAMTAEQQASFDNLLKTLVDDHGDTVYTQFAALMKAGKAVESGDLKTAHDQLQWVLQQKPEADLALITRLRLARVLLAQSDAEGKTRADEAMALINQIDQPGAFKASYEDIRGDVLLALGRQDEAREAYRLAVDLAAENGTPRPLVQLKLDDLAQSADNQPGENNK